MGGEVPGGIFKKSFNNHGAENICSSAGRTIYSLKMIQNSALTVARRSLYSKYFSGNQ
jgi:hypothetical protein